MGTLPKPFNISLAQSAQDVTFRLHDADPPSPLYIQRDDRLVLQASSLDPAVQTFTLTARLLLAGPPGFPIGLTDPQEKADYIRRSGTPIVTVQQQLVLNGVFTDQTSIVELAEGYLLSLAVSVSSTTRRGLAFARAWIQRGTLAAAPSAAALVLLADYVMLNGPLTWPGGRVIGPTEGPGAIDTFTISAPAAGAEVSNGTSNGRRRVQSIRLSLTTSATVANRTPKLRIRDIVNNIVFESGSNVVQVASTTNTYVWAPGCSAAQVDATTFLASLPDNFQFGPNGVIQTVTTNLQAGDQWAGGFMFDELWNDAI